MSQNTPRIVPKLPKAIPKNAKKSKNNPKQSKNTSKTYPTNVNKIVKQIKQQINKYVGEVKFRSMF